MYSVFKNTLPKRSFLTAALLLSLSANLNAQNNQDYVNLVKTNKKETAIARINDNKDKSQRTPEESLLAAIIETNNEHYLQAFYHFRDFYSKHPNPYPYFYAFSSSGMFNRRESATSNDVKSFLKSVMNDAKADMTSKSIAISELARRMELKNDLQGSRDMYLNLKDVQNWSTVGVFENVSGSGFNKDFGVLNHPEQEYKFKNKYGANVRWFKIPTARNDRWWDFEYNYDISNSIIYAQTFVESDADKDVILAIGVSGSMKVWVNDFLIGSESEERNTDQDVYNYKVKLNKGFNRILLQLGSSELNRSNFMVRIADLNSNDATSVTSYSTVQEYKKAAPYNAVKLPLTAEKYFEDKIAANPGDFVSKLLLLDVYNHNDKKYEARKIAAALKKEFPKTTIVSEKYIETLLRDNNQIDLDKEVEFVKTNDPESLLGLIYRYTEATDKEEWDEAYKILQKRIELFGENEDTEQKLIGLLGKKQDVPKFLEEIKRAYKKYPASTTFLAIKYAIDQNENKDLKETNGLLLDYLKDNYDESIQDEVISNYTKLGQSSEALRLSKERLEYKPYLTTRYYKIASTYYDMRKYDEAIEWIDKAIEHAPYYGSYYYAKGIMLETKGEKKDAIKMFRKSINLDPENYSARKKLRETEGKKDLFDYFKKNDIEALCKKAYTSTRSKQDDLVYLLTDQREIIYPENGAQEVQNEYLIHILTESGIDRMKEITLPYNSYTQNLVIDKAEILKKDGSKVNADTKDNELVFSSLEKGDIIHVLYKLEGTATGMLAEHFWEDYTFNGLYPVDVARFSLIVPSNKKFQYKAYNTNVTPVIDSIDDYKMYVWERKDIPAEQSEVSMPAFADVSERLVVTSIKDWDYVAKWYSDLSGVKAKGDFEIKEKVKELMQGKESYSQLEKAKVIYSYIEQNFRYSNVPFLHSAYTPQRASRTINAKLGDCKDLSTLFVAMAKEAGLSANLVLVDTRNNGENDLDLPTIGFNHCIAQLNTDNKKYYIELTNNYLPFSAFDYTLLNAAALYIPKEGEQVANNTLIKLNTPNRPVNTIERVGNVTFNGEKAVINRVTYRVGSPAGEIRSQYKDLDAEARIKDLTQSLSSDFNKNIKIETFDCSNLNNLSDSVVLKYKFSVDNFTTTIVGMQVFKMPWTDVFITHDFVSLDKRKFPLEFWYYAAVPSNKETITINLPAGKKLSEIPKNVSLSCGEMSYCLKYDIKPGKIIATREVKFLKPKVMPEAYAAFKDFVTKMNEADGKQLAFK